jgi:hypothetical protein
MAHGCHRRDPEAIERSIPMKQFLRAAALALLILPLAPAPAQTADPQVIAAQRDAMARLAWMDGVWRGPATTQTQTGPHSVTQTERIGPMLGGTLKVMEGRGYNADGSTGFNAFGILSYDPATSAYRLHSYAQGRAGDFELTPTADGYVWTIPAGPFSIRYTATLAGGTWTEVGDRIVEGQPPQRFFEMHLTRVADTDWPAANGPGPR